MKIFLLTMICAIVAAKGDLRTSFEEKQETDIAEAKKLLNKMTGLQSEISKIIKNVQFQKIELKSSERIFSNLQRNPIIVNSKMAIKMNKMSGPKKNIGILLKYEQCLTSSLRLFSLNFTYPESDLEKLDMLESELPQINEDLDSIKLMLENHLPNELELCLISKDSCRITGFYPIYLQEMKIKLTKLKLRTYMLIHNIVNYTNSEVVSDKIKEEMLPSMDKCVSEFIN